MTVHWILTRYQALHWMLCIYELIEYQPLLCNVEITSILQMRKLNLWKRLPNNLWGVINLVITLVPLLRWLRIETFDPLIPLLFHFPSPTSLYPYFSPKILGSFFFSSLNRCLKKASCLSSNVFTQGNPNSG